MRIAVVDDDEKIFETIRKVIQEFAEKNNAVIEVDYYRSGESLLLRQTEEQLYDIYLLDIEMKKMDGLSLAEVLRKNEKDAYIVFITDYTQYALRGYDVKAYQYILKSALNNKLPETLKLIYSDYIEKQEEYFVIQTNSRYEKVPYREIYYIYKEKKNSVFVTKQEKTQIRMPLQKVYEKLPKDEFIYVDRSYIVNIRYIKKFYKQEIVLTNGDMLPVSRSHMSEVKAEIGRYWRGRI